MYYWTIRLWQINYRTQWVSLGIWPGGPLVYGLGLVVKEQERMGAAESLMKMCLASSDAIHNQRLNAAVRGSSSLGLWMCRKGWGQQF